MSGDKIEKEVTKEYKKKPFDEKYFNCRRKGHENFECNKKKKETKKAKKAVD